MLKTILARATPALPWLRAAWAFAPILMAALLALVWVGSKSALNVANAAVVAAQTETRAIAVERDEAKAQAQYLARAVVMQALSAEQFGRRIARVESTLSAGLEAIAREPQTTHCATAPGVQRGLAVARGLRDADAADAARPAVQPDRPD